MTETFKYQGDELELFQHATNWKKYFGARIRPYIKGSVLEVGAGIGSTTTLLNDGTVQNWLLLEPDDQMFELLSKKISHKELPPNCKLKKGLIDQLEEKFDTIIYIDVLEHIEKDAEEIRKATIRLNPNGHIIVLSPAFQSLYNPFDKAIGHYRRYNKKSLRGITPADTQLESITYLDSVGYFASLANKFFLKKKYPTQKEVLFWDRWMVPISRLTDSLFFHRFGKSIIAVWKKGS
jgi:2-polyprenyl-3-methyl-5-hydroxy-6-metoxy-1,4-benzoquinol methylase